MQRDQVFEVNAPETNPLASESQDYATGSEVHLRVNCWQYLNIKKIKIKGWGGGVGGTELPHPPSNVTYPAKPIALILLIHL